MALRKLKLLLWKYMHLRKHHWILTACEVLLPIIIVGGLCKGILLMESPNHQHTYTSARVGRIRTAKNIVVAVRRYTILYAPETNFTRHLMESFNKTVEPSKPITPKRNEMEIEEFLSNATYGDRLMGIIFLNDGNELPDKLVYKIRGLSVIFPSTTRISDTTVSDYDSDQYHNYLDSGFSGAQIALDAAFISLKANIPTAQYINQQNLMFQTFPIPAIKKSSNSFERGIILNTLAVMVILASLIQASPLIAAIIVEKESGVKELMKLVGLEEWLVWISWFLNSLLFGIGIFTIVALLLVFNFNGDNSAALRYVDPLIIWCFIILYLIANISLCFLICSIFHRTTYAGFVYFMVMLITATIASSDSSYNLILLSSFFPPGALFLGFRRIVKFEWNGLPFTWSSLFSAEKNTLEFSLGFIFCMLLVDTFLYLILTYYISAVNPGPFGSRKSPFFIFKWLFRFSKHSSDNVTDFEGMSESKYLEKVSANMAASVRIRDLCKKFKGMYAVKGLNLNIYKNEITALLGHNGAGKTTTIAMLTGLMKPSGGSVIYNNIDVLKNMNVFRANLGFCPQEDRLFPYLSVMNHLLFFGMLKGVSEEEATKEAKSYIKLMELEGKEDNLSSALSGGMKRKLCLGIALMGNAEILILDEPTSGLDVQSRRKLWDVLLNMRGSRTVILTTHHMEEAEVLGDRIAIMHHGTIECHGTSIFLKKVYGAGYQMTITKTNDDSQKTLTNIVVETIPGAELEYQSSTEAVYRLPLTESSKFSTMFESLEKDKNNLGIKSIGVSCTTMEDVFLKVGGASIYDNADKSDGDTQTSKIKMMNKKKTGLRLVFQQMKCLVVKKFLYTARNIGNIIFRIIVPTVCGMFILWVVKDISPVEPALDLSLPVYPGSYIMVQKHNLTNMENSFTEYVRKYGDEVIFSNGHHIIDGLLDYSRKNLLSYRQDLVLAAEFNPTSQLLLCSRQATHSAAIAVNSYANIFLQSISGSDKYGIVAINHPVTLKSMEQNVLKDLIIYVQLVWWVLLGFFTMDLCEFFNISIQSERVEGFKHIQLMSNVSPFIYWLSNFFFDFLLFMSIIVLRILLFKPVDSFNFVDFGHITVITLLVFIIFIPAGLLFIYVVSFISKSKDESYTFASIFNIVGCILVGIYYALELKLTPTPPMNQFNIWVVVFYVVEYVILFVPPLNFCLTMIKLTSIWRMNNSPNFEYLGDATANINIRTMLPYLEFYSTENPNGFLGELIYLGIDITIYSLLLVIIETGTISKLFNYASVRIYSSTNSVDNKELDRNVEMERRHVDEYARDLLKRTNSGLVLLVSHLKKQYINWFRPFVAVHDVTFNVKAAQCFGLLGVNGAGKSTTFKILAGEVLATHGDASIFNSKLSRNKNDYMAKTGYCAQTNCFVEELTGREMLTLIASLRGVHLDQITLLVDKWLSILGLEIYQNRRCGSYSGGNKRKLCTALSLIGDPNVVFLDEPTSGVDPVSRRKLYDVMDQSKSAGQAVVLTSHSMEECEQLCDRLTIMVRGQMKCIGTVQELKQQFAQGFSLQIKLVDVPNLRTLSEVIKKNIVNKFGEQFCLLKDEHKGLLYYHVTDTQLPWSEAFRRMENIKAEHISIIEDYIIADTSLEQVFLSFSKSS